MSTRRPQNRPAEKPSAIQPVTDLPASSEQAAQGSHNRLSDDPCRAGGVDYAALREALEPAFNALTKVLVNVPEAAYRLSISRAVVYELIRSGRLRSVTEGRTRLIPVTALAEYVALLERETHQSTPLLKAVA